jgi:hypothetical protein
MPSKKALPRCLSSLALTVALVPLSGCATTTFAPEVESVGDFRDMSAARDAAEDLEPSQAKDVVAISGTLPEGIELRDGTLHVDPERYEVLGKVSASENNAGNALFGVWVYPYAEGETWRYGYCGWQVPLSWVTLSLWAWLSPLHYPCKVAMGEPQARREQIVKTLQRATKALGGDTVAFAFGGLSVVNRSGVVINSFEAMHGEGLALKSRSRPTPTPVVAVDDLPRALDLTARR